MKNNVSVSIIIPHYNTTDSLKKLINKIPSRLDLELIIVDDNSDELAFREYESYLKEYNCIYIKNDTGKKGAGVCRNLGIERASGKWLLFADSDDYFCDDFLNIVSTYFDSEYDLIFFGTVRNDEGNPQRKKQNQKSVYRNERNMDLFLSRTNESKKAEIELRYNDSVPWGKMVRKKIVDDYGIRFDEVITGNDMGFACKVGYYANSIWVDKRVIYNYVFRSNSISHDISIERHRARVDAHVLKNKFLSSNLDNNTWKMVDSSLKYLIKQGVFYQIGVKEMLSMISVMKRNKDNASWYEILVWVVRYNLERIFKKYVRGIR